MASYDELNAFAQSKGGRIPTEAELRLFMDDQASRGRRAPAQAGASRDGGQNLPLSATQLETSLHTTVASGNGLQLCSSKHDGFKSSVLYPGYR
jgi:hypothetical protein